jgi:orotate phosphoribosyltransferase
MRRQFKELAGGPGDIRLETKVKELESLLKEVEAFQSGHFLLASGLHSNHYVQCQKLLQYPRHGMVFAEAMAKAVVEAGLKPSAVVGPALGAVHLELLVALALDRALGGKPVRGIFAERPEGKFEIRRGVQIEPGEKILVVEDVTTTGGSARKVVDLVRELGGEPIAVGAIIDRSGGAASFDVPFISLVQINVTAYEPDKCPMCKAGDTVTKPGSSKTKP